MDDKTHSLKLLLLDHFPKLTDTQIRKVNRISDEVCSCTVHVSNYTVPKLTSFIEKVTRCSDKLTAVRVLEFTVTGEIT